MMLVFLALVTLLQDDTGGHRARYKQSVGQELFYTRRHKGLSSADRYP